MFDIRGGGNYNIKGTCLETHSTSSVGTKVPKRPGKVSSILCMELQGIAFRVYWFGGLGTARIHDLIRFRRSRNVGIYWVVLDYAPTGDDVRGR